MADELPPLDKFVVSGYSAGDPAYPIVIVVKDSRALGYTVPAIAALCPDARYSGHKFVGITPTSIDNRVVWTYKLLPGPTVTSWEHDPESDVFISTSRTEDFLSGITPAITKEDAVSVTITEEEAADAYTGFKVVTVIPKGDFYGSSNYIEEVEMLPFQFPALLLSTLVGGTTMTLLVDIYGTAVGHRAAASDTVEHFIRRWWVISATRPTLDYDEITPADITVNFVPYRNVLHDTVTRDYGSMLTVPGTTPTATQYYGTVNPADPFAAGTGTKWVGTERVIKGSVKRAGSKYRWRVETISVEMK